MGKVRVSYYPYDCCDGLSKTIYAVYLCLDLLSFIAYVCWVILLVMDDGDEGDARVPNNLLIGLDELQSWHDGGLPHSCP